jgi:hypothetical protein
MDGCWVEEGCFREREMQQKMITRCAERSLTHGQSAMEQRGEGSDLNGAR